jgi:hypothetical protein
MPTVETVVVTRGLSRCSHLSRDTKGWWWPCLTTVETDGDYCADHAPSGRLSTVPDLRPPPEPVVPLVSNVLPVPSPVSETVEGDGETDEVPGRAGSSNPNPWS